MDIFGFVNIPNWLLLLIFAGFLLYWYLTINHDHFKKQSINGPKPYPFIGTSYTLMGAGGICANDMKQYKLYGGKWGEFFSRTPGLMISDPEVLKKVMVKEANDFTNRFMLQSFEDPLVMSMLTTLRDDDWKRVRNLVTPTFSTGKLKVMCQVVNECARVYATNIGKVAQDGGSFEAKELSGGFTMDAIAQTAFGLRVDSQNNPNNAFVKNAKLALKQEMTPTLFILLFCPFLWPLFQRMGMRLMDNQMLEFFTKIVEDVMELRKKEAKEGKVGESKDFMSLMISAHEDHRDTEELEREASEMGDSFSSENKPKKGLTKNEVLAQGLLFFIGGYETTASTIAFLLYHLAIHPEWQDTVYNEIIEVLGTDEDIDVDYRKLAELQTLDNCLHETLRIFPPASRTDRSVSRDVVIDGIHMPANSLIGVPIHAIHHDPKIWPEPEKFDPNRFAPEARAKMNPYHFLAFGFGPRNCIGMRLALMEVKLATVHLLRKCKVLLTNQTKIPLELKGGMGLLNAKDGIHIKPVLR